MMSNFDFRIILSIVCVFSVVLSKSPKHTQVTTLNQFFKSHKHPISEQHTSNPLHIIPQPGSKEADLIGKLPGQPDADFHQYSGYITVDEGAGRALFYYFAEASKHPSTKPLLLWLNGGPRCSSLGFGAMEELGPFRVNADGRTLYYNKYGWNKVANILFVESPVGVGFSYSNSSSNYTTGDTRTAQESYTFLINWLERFPEYKTRSFFIGGESYAGHYVPQLASLILSENKKTNQTIIHLTGIAIGNALIEDTDADQGMYEYFYTHAFISDETYAAISHYCDFKNMSDKCYQYTGKAYNEMGNIDIFNIYAPLCDLDTQKPGSHHGSVFNFDPCTDEYVSSYLNRADVQQALHARNTVWAHCGDVWWTDSPTTVLPTLSQLIENGISVWIYSGDTDGRIPVTSTRKTINKMKLPIKSAWRPWYINKEVGGYVVEYKGIVMATVRGAGHEVPSYQPLRALAMISAFLRGELPPPLRG